MCWYLSHSLRGVSPHNLSVPILIPFPIFVERPHTTTFIDSQSNFGVEHVYRDLFPKSIPHNKVD